MYITTYVIIYIQGSYTDKAHQLRNTTKNLQQNTVAKQNKLQKQKQNHLLELKYKYLNDGMVAASDTFNSKLFHNTALQQKNSFQNW